MDGAGVLIEELDPAGSHSCSRCSFDVVGGVVSDEENLGGLQIEGVNQRLKGAGIWFVVSDVGLNYAAVTLTKVRFLGPLISNLTKPSLVANKVSSLPRPTLTPG